MYEIFKKKKAKYGFSLFFKREEGITIYIQTVLS